MEKFEIKDGVLIKYNGNEKKVVIPDNVNEIGVCAFEFKNSIKSVTFPSSVKKIDASAFQGCDELATLKFSDKLEFIDDFAFGECNKLKSVYIPKGVKEIKDSFTLCWKLEEIIVDEDNEYYKSIDGVLYNKDCTEIIKYPEGKKGDTFKIPQSVKKIGLWAFGESMLKHIEIPETVEEIDEYAFFDCRNIRELKIPNSIKEIKFVSFGLLKNLQFLTIPGSVIKINNSAFAQCDNLKRITYQGRKEDWEKIEINEEDNDCLKKTTINFSCEIKSKKQITDFKNYLFLDNETNGLDYDKDEIIKFMYAVADDKLKIKKREEFFVNTGNTIISKEISTITGITQQDIEQGKNSKFLIDVLKEIINTDTLVISYNLDFTMEFIKNFLRRNNASYILDNVYYLDILYVFRSYEDLRRYRIKDAVKFYNINAKCNGKDDVDIYYKLFKKMIKKYDLNLFIR